MTLRNLTPEEEAVFDLIKEQREQNDTYDDYFLYDAERGARTLRHDGKASKYGIGLSEQHKIIRKMVRDGILDANWVTEADDDKLDYKFKYPIEDEILNRYKIALDPVFVAGGHYRDKYIIKLSFNYIKNINDTCRPKYQCTLSCDKTQRLFIRCNKEKLVIKKLKYGMLPSEVLKNAVKRHTEVITRDCLNKSKDNKLHIGKLSIATQVFDKNSIVRNELKPFVRLSPDGIKVTPTVQLTLIQLNKIREICF